LNPTSAALGFGCHPSRGIALSRALTEAAQSRLTAISGSRDDQTRGMYRAAQSADSLEYFRRTANERGAQRDFASLPTHVGETLEDDLQWVLERLGAAGHRQVLAVDLSRAGLPISVVRVLIPGLEGPIDSKLYLPGPRARAARSR
jgi:ribosomal protein S12 methylthiotransferase accessory factor